MLLGERNSSYRLKDAPCVRSRKPSRIKPPARNSRPHGSAALGKTVGNPDASQMAEVANRPATSSTESYRSQHGAAGCGSVLGALRRFCRRGAAVGGGRALRGAKVTSSSNVLGPKAPPHPASPALAVSARAALPFAKRDDRSSAYPARGDYRHRLHRPGAYRGAAADRGAGHGDLRFGKGARRGGAVGDSAGLHGLRFRGNARVAGGGCGPHHVAKPPAFRAGGGGSPRGKTCRLRKAAGDECGGDGRARTNSPKSTRRRSSR